MIFGLFLVAISLFGIGTFVMYPWLLRLLRIIGEKPINSGTGSYSISVLLAVRNGRELLPEKLENLRQTQWPGPLQVLIYSDGSTDGTEEYLRTHAWEDIHIFSEETSRGKAHRLTEMLPHCTGDLLLFTDADAIFAPDAVMKLSTHFHDPQIGGVCGQRRIAQTNEIEITAQQDYIGLDSSIKIMETQLGSLTSNDGKLYALRRNLARPIPGPVTDDLWEAMGVVLAGFRFTFEPESLAFIKPPVRDLTHELSRRRRIVSTSLTGIWKSRVLLNPFKFGKYALCLFINKVNRRLLPIWLLGLFFAPLFMALDHPIFLTGSLVQFLGYLVLFLLHRLRLTRLLPRVFAKLADKCIYFAVGCLGMLFGVLDFAMGKTPSQWEPKKSA